MDRSKVDQKEKVEKLKSFLCVLRVCTHAVQILDEIKGC